MKRLILMGLLVSCSVLPAIAQPPPPPPEGTDDFNQVLFFNDALVRAAINRIADEMGRHYKLDDEQLAAAREVMQARFPQFVQENRDDITLLVNDWMAAILDERAPDGQRVADWATRAQPLMDKFFGLVDESAGEIRTFLNDDQRVILDGEKAMLDVGVRHVTGRVAEWADGGFDPEIDWPKGSRFKETQQAEAESIMEAQNQAREEAVGQRWQDAKNKLYGDGSASAQGAADGPGATRPPRAAQPGTAKPASSTDEWAIYVEAYIRKYQLDDAQRNACHKVLERMTDLRDRYLVRKLPEIEKLEQELNKPELKDTERDTLRKKYDELNAPIERYFKMLKDRLERIPTRKQRAEAAAAETAQPAAGATTKP